MKPTAYVINSARGGIINTVALHKALREAWIAGAALDVLPEEPPNPDEPLLELDNIILTPHVAFLSEESGYDLQVLAAQEMARVLSGQMPESVVNPSVLGKVRRCAQRGSANRRSSARFTQQYHTAPQVRLRAHRLVIPQDLLGPSVPESSASTARLVCASDKSSASIASLNFAIALSRRPC